MRFAAPLLVFALVGLPASGPAATARPIVVVAANQSFNRAGYVQDALEKNTTFHSIAATWVVPTATPRIVRVRPSIRRAGSGSAGGASMRHAR